MTDTLAGHKMAAVDDVLHIHGPSYIKKTPLLCLTIIFFYVLYNDSIYFIMLKLLGPKFIGSMTQCLGKDPMFRLRPNTSSLKSREDPICL